VLILRSLSGDVHRVELDIDDYHIAEVRSLVKEVRTVRRVGVDPEICSCEVCVTRPEVMQFVRDRKGTSLLYGIAGKRSKALRRLGITSLDDVIACDAETVLEDLKILKHFVSSRMVQQWKLHAASYRDGAPVRVGDDVLDFTSFIAIDFEYDPSNPGNLYLIGAALVRGSDVVVEQWWGDGFRETEANLGAFAAFLHMHPDLPIVTWSGETAEIPEITKAVELYMMGDVLAALYERHYDMFRFSERNVRFPIRTLDLKSVGGHRGVLRRTEISGGMAALGLWWQYQKAKAPERKRIKEALLDYNKDDLEALIEISRRIVELCGAAAIA
jgi:predicted RecB family nuclease